MRALFATLLAVSAACDGEVGTVSVSLAIAPGSTILDGVQTLRMEVTNPRTVVMAERSGDGFELVIDLPAEGTTAAILVDGFDADGALVANGATPTFAFGGMTGAVVVYMAAPDSVAVAPESLAVARSEIGVAALPYGAVFVGGRGADGVASGAVDLYNAYNHTLQEGMALPGARAAAAVSASQTGVHIFGGVDEGGAPRATLWRFDPQVAPAGAYVEIGDKSGFERGGERFVTVADEQFLLTGTPPAELFALDGSLRERSGIATLPTAGVTLLGVDGMRAAIFAGESGVVRYRNGTFETLSAPARAGVEVAAIGGGKALVVCGTTDALRVDAATGTSDTVAGVPGVAKTGCAVAATARHLVIAGGTTTSGVDGSVEVFDSATLERIATATLAVPRTGAVAVALPNQQILIAGGIDAAGAPVATLELFTPLTTR